MFENLKESVRFDYQDSYEMTDKIEEELVQIEENSHKYASDNFISILEEIIENNPHIDWNWFDDGISDNTMELGKIKWIEKKRLEIIKALQIQRHWRNCICNPIFKLARKKINEKYKK